MELFDIQKADYSWHPALFAMESCDKDPRALDDLVERVRDLGGVTHTVCVCSDRGGRWLLLTPPREVDAFFTAYQGGNIKVRILYKEEAASVLVSTIMDWPGATAGHHADALREVKEWFNLPDIQIARMAGKSRPVITNLLRLNNLDPNVMLYLKLGKISGAQARTLAALDRLEQIRLCNSCFRLGWSYKQLYEAAHPKRAAKQKGVVDKSPDVKRLERIVTERSGVLMEFDPSDQTMTQGTLRFKFGTVGEIERLLELIAGTSKSESQNGKVEFVIENLGQVDRLLSKLMTPRTKK